MRGAEMVEDVRLLVDSARYAEATTLDLNSSSYLQVRAYIENHPEDCYFDGEEFVPVRVCRSRWLQTHRREAEPAPSNLGAGFAIVDSPCSRVAAAAGSPPQVL